jgi:hypothetical protein
MDEYEEFEKYSAWLDDGWLTEPGQLRDGDSSLTVIRQEDLKEIQDKLGSRNAKPSNWTTARLVPWTIPMLMQRGFQPVDRIGGYPVAAEGTSGRVIADAQQEQSLTWRLSDDGMDLLERAGLAGLYMALRAASEQGADLSPLTWREDDLRPDSVTIRWTGPAKPAFAKLMEWAWQVRDGVLFFPAIHGERERLALQYRVASHNGIMRTFLQHVNSQPKLDTVTKVIPLDEWRSCSATKGSSYGRMHRCRIGYIRELPGVTAASSHGLESRNRPCC